MLFSGGGGGGGGDGDGGGGGSGSGGGGGGGCSVFFTFHQHQFGALDYLPCLVVRLSPQSAFHRFLRAPTTIIRIQMK